MHVVHGYVSARARHVCVRIGCVCICVCVCISEQVYLHTCMSVCHMYVCVCVRARVHAYPCGHVCVPIPMCACVCPCPCALTGKAVPYTEASSNPCFHPNPLGILALGPLSVLRATRLLRDSKLPLRPHLLFGFVTFPKLAGGGAG